MEPRGLVWHSLEPRGETMLTTRLQEPARRLAFLLVLCSIQLAEPVWAAPLRDQMASAASAAAPAASTVVSAATSSAPGMTSVTQATTTPVNAPATTSVAEAPAYTPRGADTCIRCHDDPKVLSIFKTRHAVQADARTPFAHLQCEACHGAGANHGAHLHPGEPRPPIPRFGKDSPATVAEGNAVCLSCHQDSEHVGWQGSVHDREGLSCTSCHQIHPEHDPVMAVSSQPDVCYQCHQKERADFQKTSAHPVYYGNMDCSSCHSVHDSLTPALLNAQTLNDTCFTCHAEKRGPFLWEHAPAAEDCSNCHVPHGSVNPALLTSRPPLLCQSCHATQDHPSFAFTSGGLPGRAPNGFLLEQSCMNCHSQVHGSNDPSGAVLNR